MEKDTSKKILAYIDLLHRDGKATLKKLTAWTNSNEFVTELTLKEPMKEKVIYKEGDNYFLNQKVWETLYPEPKSI